MELFQGASALWGRQRNALLFVSHEVGDVIKPLRGGGNYRVSPQRENYWPLALTRCQDIIIGLRAGYIAHLWIHLEVN